MFKKIEEMLLAFRPVFSRQKAFEWFVVIVTGIMLRQDSLGATSVIRALFLPGNCYTTMMHFFRANSWGLNSLRNMHSDVVKKNLPLFRNKNKVVLVADGSKKSKEGRYMPGVKRYKQESETQSKAQMIFGHLWGCIGILTKINNVIACTPISNRIHDGLRGMENWEDWSNYDFSVGSHVVQIIKDSCAVANRLKEDALLLLDRYHLTVPALMALNAHNSDSMRKGYLHVLIKAKRSTRGYLPVSPAIGKRTKGRPKKKGDKVCLWEIFNTRKSEFKETKIRIYGKRRTASYYCIDLLWGKGLLMKLRFVLVELDSGEKSIFATTDLSLHPRDVIRLYALRFSIEQDFRAMKQNIGSFAYHFWTKAMPKLNRFSKSSDPNPVEKITERKEQIRILETLKATEMFMLVSIVAMSILHALTMYVNTPEIRQKLRYQRTPAGSRPSEDNMMVMLRHIFWQFLVSNPNSIITTIIRKKQKRFFCNACENAA